MRPFSGDLANVRTLAGHVSNRHSAGAGLLVVSKTSIGDGWQMCVLSAPAAP